MSLVYSNRMKEREGKDQVEIVADEGKKQSNTTS